MPISKKKKAKAGIQPPASPAPPPPPVDWVALSKERGPAAEADTPPVAQDDWTLIRTSGGQSGWVLTSRVYMSIPDDVAQYAEGHRITSYFVIGSVADKGEQKNIWLWTTAESLGQDHDFDSYRVFTWSTKRHRYETAYIQRREQGYQPVLAKPERVFRCACREQSGRTGAEALHTLTGVSVRPADEQPCEAMPERLQKPRRCGLDQPIELHAPPAAKKSILGTVRAKFKVWFGL